MTAIANLTASRSVALGADRTNRALVFGDLARYATRDLLPLPVSIAVNPITHMVSIELQDGDRDGVDRWAAELGLPKARQADVWRDINGKSWATYLTTGTHALWRGWHVSVCCTVPASSRGA